MVVPYDFNSDDCPTLYHYTTFSGARAIVESRTMWLSDHAAMNDSSEFSYARDRLYALLQAGAVSLDPPVKRMIMDTVGGLTESVGLFIGSLTAREDDLNQWRSYADNGRGCVVAIDARYLEQDAGVAMHTVIYDNDAIDLCLSTGLDIIQEQYEIAPKDADDLEEMVRGLASSLFVMKHPGFAEEREVRASRMVIRGADGFIDVGGNRGPGVVTSALDVRSRKAAYGDTPFIALPLTRDDGSSAITGVGLGPTMSPADAVSAARQFGELGVPIWHSKLPYRI